MADLSAPQDEAELAARIRAGDERAFEVVWARYHVALIGFAARYLRSSDAAADAVQQAFLALWVGRVAFAPRTTLAAYLYRAVWHRVQDALRHARVEYQYELRVVAEQAVEPRVAPHDGERGVEDRDRRALVERLLERMTPRVREIFLLSREDGLTAPQIAEALGISPQVVYNQLSRAAKVLAEGIRELDGID